MADGGLSSISGHSRALPSVAILLSTFNGEAFVSSLLESIIGQTYPNITIYVRDDGSKDRTLALVQASVGRRLILVRDDYGNLGPAGSFLALLRTARADIYMFCDQDDVWKNHKVTSAVQAILDEGIDRPLLFHTDLLPVDRELKPIANSFFQHEKINVSSAHDMRRLLVQNCIVGCTMAITDALVTVSDLRNRQPEGVAMHDWWLALVAACFGKILVSMDAPILYRQHGANVSGVRNSGLLRRFTRKLTTEGLSRIDSYKRRIGRQAKAFRAFYDGRLSEEQKIYLRAVEGLERGRGLVGCLRCTAHGIWLQNWYMNVAFVVSSAFAPSEIRTTARSQRPSS